MPHAIAIMGRHAELCNNNTMSEPSRLPTVSTVEAVAHVLRQQILDGHFPPGTFLREEALSARLGVGRHSLRAAIQVLAHQGLLRHEANRGAYVPSFDAHDIADVFDLRIGLERRALEIGFERGLALGAVAAAVAAMRALGEAAPWRAVTDADLDFHRAFVASAGSERLSAAFASAESEIVLCLLELRPHYGGAADVADEHARLLEALGSGDRERARRELAIHLEEARDVLVAATAEVGPIGEWQRSPGARRAARA
jgi:DNA-binding GntR family transcriptional regulator